MIVLDAYAVIALLRGERAATDVADLLVGETCALTPLGVAEVVDRLVRLAGADPDDVALDLAELGLLEPRPLTAAAAVRAGSLRSRRYHGSACAVSLADCVVVEVAREEGGVVATSDPHLLDVCLAEELPAVVLPDTTGRYWTPP
ncbi:MAG: PIN domain-containing protein [Actinomycetota bacterium]